MSGRHVIVIGGGIAGLAAAHRLAHDPTVERVTVLEADDRLGGKILTTPFAGRQAVDEGADAFLARVPWATDLARSVGLGDQLVSPDTAKAAVWWNRLHPIPDGLLLGMPTDLGSMGRTRLLTPLGKLRAAAEVLMPRSHPDDSIGAYVRHRFGRQVHERLVDPLIGSIYAADTDRFSLAAVPQLADLAAASRSVLIAARHRPPPPTGPVFYTPTGGVGALVACVAARLGPTATVVTGRPVTSIEPDRNVWRVDGEAADAVLLACPAAITARLLGIDDLAVIPVADVVLITLAVPAAGWPQRLSNLSGYLVPKPVQRWVTAVSFASQKWARWSSDDVLLRVSLGRDGASALHLDNDELISTAIAEVSRHLGVDLQPTLARVTRWPGAFPQYRPYHAERIATIEGRLPPGLALAGASYHGIGIPACVRSGQAAATALAEHLKTLAD